MHAFMSAYEKSVTTMSGNAAVLQSVLAEARNLNSSPSIAKLLLFVVTKSHTETLQAFKTILYKKAGF